MIPLKWLLKTYFTLDLRSLGFARIVLGLTLLCDWFTRYQTRVQFLTNEGVFPNHYSLFNPPEPYWSALHAFSQVGEVTVVLWIVFVLYVLFLSGIGGVGVRFFTLLSAVSINSRNIWVENGGHIVLNLFLLWSVFLPVDQRFSLKSFLIRKKPSLRESLHPGTYTSAFCLGIIISIVCIYLFNFLTKTGDTWRTGTAVYYTLHLAERVTPFGVWVRNFFPFEFLQLVSLLTYFFEFIAPFLILFPFVTRYFRSIGICCGILLHFSIFLCITLGPFSWAMISIWMFLIPSEVWNKIQEYYCDKKENPESTETQNNKSWVRGVREAAAVILIAAVVLESIYTYRAFMNYEQFFERPEWSASLVKYFRIPQNWRMFAYDAPMEGRMIVFAGTKEDGSIENVENGFPIDTESLERYFQKSQNWNYCRIEWGTRYDAMPQPDYGNFLLEYLKNEYPSYKKFQVFELTKETPDPLTQEATPLEIRLLQETTTDLS